MSITASYLNIYNFLNSQAQGYDYGYDTRPGLTSPSFLKEQILKAFTMPGVEVFFRRASDNPCTDHGDDLSIKPRLFLNTIYGCGIEIPTNVYMDIRGPLGKDHLIKIKFKDSTGRSQTYQYIDTLTASDKECITITGDVNLYVTEVNYLLNPRYAYVNSYYSTHLGPIYSSEETSTGSGGGFSNPVSPTGADYVNGPSGISYFNLPGYNIGNNKQVAGICDRNKSYSYGLKSFAYAKSLTASYQPGTSIGLFSTSNTVPELLNMVPIPIVIFRTGAKDNRGKSYFSYSISTTGEHPIATIRFSDNTTLTYTLQEEEDAFVEYQRTANTKASIPATEKGGNSATTDDKVPQLIQGFLLNPNYGNIPGYSDFYDLNVTLSTQCSSLVKKYTYDNQVVDITTTSTDYKRDSLYRQIGKYRDLPNQELVVGSIGAIATSADYIDRNNAGGGDTSDKKIAIARLPMVLFGRADPDKSGSKKTKLVNTRGVFKCYGSNFYDLDGYYSDGNSNVTSTVDRCTIDKLEEHTSSVSNPHVYYNNNYGQTSVSTGYTTNLHVEANIHNVPPGFLSNSPLLYTNSNNSGGSALDGSYYTPNTNSFYSYGQGTIAFGAYTYSSSILVYSYHPYGVSWGYSIEADISDVNVNTTGQSTYKALVLGTFHPGIHT